MHTACDRSKLGRSLLWGLLFLALTGCGRTLTIRQDPFINTASQASRPAEKRTGEPLELAIVCVYPPDLDKPGNELLRPDSKITSKDWYERRPQTGAAEPGHFQLPNQQIFVLTNDKQVYGRVIGSALRGANLDGEAPIKKSGVQYKWGDLHADKGVIYVFGKFIGRDGSVLPVPPAKFHPPGAFTDQLEVKIGVDADRSLDTAQYIKVLSERKMHGQTDK